MKTKEDISSGNTTELERLKEELLRSRAELAVARENEKNLGILIDSVPALVACVGAHDLCYRFINQACADLFGFLPEKVIGKHVRELIGEESFKNVLPPIDQARAGKCSTYDKAVSIRGRHYWFNFRFAPEFDEQKTVRNIIFMAVDITERKAAEEALKRSESLLNRTQAIAHIGSWEQDLSNWTLSWSDEVYRIFGLVPQEFAGTQDAFTALVHPEDRAAVAEAYYTSFRDGIRFYEIIHRVVHPHTGEIRFVHERCEHVKDDSGNPVRSVGIVQDITDRKRAELEKEKLEAQNRQLQKSESLGRLAAAIAHNFNNQLQVISGNLEIALSELNPDTVKAVEFLNEAMRATGRASEVSSLMLTYLGQTLGKRDPLDLADVCKRYLPMLQASKPKNVKLEPSFPASGLIVKADVSQIQQVLANLVTNAWEAFDKGPGEIRLSLKTIDSSDIPEGRRFPVDSSPKKDIGYACLELTDSGKGISPNNIGNIFDPFFSTKFIGRGMGLPVVLGIVRAHDGFITVESEPGRGSVFRLYFPLSEEAIPRQEGKAVDTPKMQMNGAILLVEDDETVRQVTEIMLSDLGFVVYTASDGFEAVEVFRNHSQEICCVLCDLTMPRMDGWETLVALRQLVPGIPVILASGYSESQVMAEHHVERPQAFLGKPFLFEQLCETVRRVMKRKNT